MKHLLIIIFSLLLTSVSWCDDIQFKNFSLHNTIENYKWKKRILILITKEEKKDTALVNEINKFFITQKCKNELRNLEFLKIRKNNTHFIKRTVFL